MYTSTESIQVSCKVSNIGIVTGSEVVQVYVGKSTSKVKRATKELKGFKKINVKNETTATVEISIAVSDLAFYNEAISNWELEKGDYEIYVGNASDAISKKLKITIQ